MPEFKVNGGLGDWAVKVGIGAVVALFIGQFVPMLKTTATSGAEIAALKKDLSEFRAEVRGGFEKLPEQIRVAVAAHAAQPSHNRALELLLEHDRRITAIEGKSR